MDATDDGGVSNDTSMSDMSNGSTAGSSTAGGTMTTDGTSMGGITAGGSTAGGTGTTGTGGTTGRYYLAFRTKKPLGYPRGFLASCCAQTSIF
ncbi:hypothetical protein GCM10023186_19090 [Hymenobacter koreensis]|uniref:Uncharacterized protein n=1 Tax=Hymenobacter koreensis TaxID=1084523 RepID=A0ABP8IYK8_9BACT